MTGRHRAPHRLRPRRIIVLPRDDMNVELRHHIADRRNVELVASRHGLECARRKSDLGHELNLIGCIEIDDFTHAEAPRHQQQPWVISIFVQEQPRQWQFCNRHAILHELRMQ